jgi:hypothetical protein
MLSRRRTAPLDGWCTLSVLSDMDGHQESQFEWLSAKLLSGSKVKECCQVQHLVHNFIVGTFANQFPIGFFSIPPALHC